MQVYIRSTGNISPQHSLEKDLFFAHREMQDGNRWHAVEPEYSRYVDSKMIRRMSRIVRMGVAASKACLDEAEVRMPSGIVTGTAYGCLEDTGIFLRRMIDNQEELLTPTAFIQSTHNTVGAQIALLLKCHGYNNTIVHRGFSFENALMDAMLLLREGMDNVLAGAIDEITEDSHAILSRFGLYIPANDNPEITAKKHKGSVAGEGASFFLLSSQEIHGARAILRGISTIYKPESLAGVESRIHAFLKESSVLSDGIGLVLSGTNGDGDHDEIDNYLSVTAFRNKTIIPFKQLCGEYPTASGFALWLAVLLISEQKTPDWLPNVSFPLRNILIHNHYDNSHHALYLISAC
jgi:3-oxoacyl-[acyl-carrier-protein] synthase II